MAIPFPGGTEKRDGRSPGQCICQCTDTACTLPQLAKPLIHHDLSINIITNSKSTLILSEIVCLNDPPARS
ncbi:hypothetical protein SXCC_01010 [Gluconacetobacter sp. SXCC-1]|nr:hypothetical protein SXCC_01010 [Gluconacetobacter sp. SXCC-1]